MTIQAIKDGIIYGVSAAYQATKGAVLWGGHKIQAGYANYLIPTIKSLWTSAIAGLNTIAKLLKTGPGMAFSTAVILFFAGKSLIKLSQSDDYADNRPGKIALAVLGITGLIGAALSVGIGVSALTAV